MKKFEISASLFSILVLLPCLIVQGRQYATQRPLWFADKMDSQAPDFEKILYSFMGDHNESSLEQYEELIVGKLKF